MGRDLRRYRAPRCPESGPRKSRSIPRKEVPHSEIREHKAMTDVVRTKDLRNAEVTSGGALVRTVDDVIRSPNRRKAADTMAQAHSPSNERVSDERLAALIKYGAPGGLAPNDFV